MPKILDNVRERAVEAAREIILRDGYDAMTVRMISRKLGIGLGTLYNYFPAKEYLAAAVMMEDWNAFVERFREQPPFETPLSAVENLFGEVRKFTGRYRLTWDQYGKHRSAKVFRERYHAALVAQLKEILTPRIPEEAVQALPTLPWFLAETCVRFGSDEETAFEDLVPILKKIL